MIIWKYQGVSSLYSQIKKRRLNHFSISQGCVYWGTAALGGCFLCKMLYTLSGGRVTRPLLKPAPQGGAGAWCGGWLGPWPWPWQCRQRAAAGECPWPRQFSPGPGSGSGPRRDNAVLVAAWPRRPQHRPRLGICNFDINTDNIPWLCLCIVNSAN